MSSWHDPIVGLLLTCGKIQTRKEDRQKLRNFLNQTEEDRIKKLCISVESNEKLFWKLIKSQRSSSQMSAFLVNGNLLTDKSAIRDMWADHFEALGTPSENIEIW